MVRRKQPGPRRRFPVAGSLASLALGHSEVLRGLTAQAVQADEPTRGSERDTAVILVWLIGG